MLRRAEERRETDDWNDERTGEQQGSERVGACMNNEGRLWKD